VKKALEFSGADVTWHDPYLPDSADLDEVLNSSDAIVMCTPHREYNDIKYKCPVVDVWGVVNKPTLEVLPGKEETTKVRKVV
jgi:UDP-N-acetyl-D-mannosaminuronic acid dehydrogenase